MQKFNKLSKAEMKGVKGGDVSGGCNIHCFDKYGEDIGGSTTVDCDYDTIEVICDQHPGAVDASCVC